MNLDKINKELKIYINEASSISNSCKNKLLKIFNEEFNLDLDINNYKNIDLSITKDFKVLYRDDLYESKDNIKKLDDVVERYNSFKTDIENILNKTKVDFETKSRNNNIKNIIVTLILTILVIVVFIGAIIELFKGNIYGTIWFIIILVSYNIIPNIRDSLKERYNIAFRYLKKLLKNLKK